jgi:hypothetical protein
MRRRYMVWTGHFLLIAILVFGIWWLGIHISELPDYRLMTALVSATGLLLNHFRWRRFIGNIADVDIVEKINHFMVANYLVMLLALTLVDLRRH